jgi:tRNA(adenine34) deaminase
MIAKTDRFDTDHSAIDVAMVERCIRLSAAAAQRGELPFAALICKGRDLVIETTNQVVQDADVTRHAELVAISQAQKILGRRELADCALYSTVEPCAMCSFAARETRIGRVVFSIRSPMMGGLSKWNVLRDTELSDAMPEVFGPVPEVIAGLSRHEAEKVWETWNPLFWAVIRRRGYLGRDETSTDREHLHAIPERRSLLRRIFDLHTRRPV